MYVYDLSSWCWKKLLASLKFIFAHFPHQILWCLCPGTTKAFWTFFYPEGSNFRFLAFFELSNHCWSPGILTKLFFQVPGLKYAQQAQNCDLVTFFQIAWIWVGFFFEIDPEILFWTQRHPNCIFFLQFFSPKQNIFSKNQKLYL